MSPLGPEGLPADSREGIAHYLESDGHALAARDVDSPVVIQNAESSRSASQSPADDFMPSAIRARRILATDVPTASAPPMRVISRRQRTGGSPSTVKESCMARNATFMSVQRAGYQ